MRDKKDDHLEFCRILLLEIAPDEVEFLTEYNNASKISGLGKRLGPEFGSNDGTEMILGYIIVLIGQKVFDLIIKIFDGVIIDKGKAELKNLLESWKKNPKDNDISFLPKEGKDEIISVVSRYAVEANLPIEEIERIKKQFAKTLFGDK